MNCYQLRRHRGDMSFTSPEFVIFFAVVIPLFFLIRHRWRWILLLAASYLFYAYGMAYYLPLIMFSTLVNYVTARMIPLRESQLWRRSWLAASLSINLGVLFLFKYLDFFSSSVGYVAGNTPQSLNLVLPIGISFYTFQAMSYTISVYRGDIQPERHLGIVATFIAFFPQLVAGPIERAANLMPQFRQVQKFDTARVVEGFQLILWGAFKKIVIADRLAIYVNTVYGDLPSYTGGTLWLATFFFAFQIYCDFSAYSDIAIGTARVMDFDLMENFRQPYFARSVREFWGRWHISLSTWFRDYVYVPLGGNRVRLSRQLLNLMIVFLISGLWHGAGWTFIIWGALHGMAVVLLALMRHYGWDMLPRGWLGTSISMLATFAFICFTWIFFRAETLPDALYVIQHMFDFNAGAGLNAPFAGGLLGAEAEFTLAFALIAGVMLADGLTMTRGIPGGFRRLPVVPRWALYYGLGAAVVFSGLYTSGAQQFIYFQF